MSCRTLKISYHLQKIMASAKMDINAFTVAQLNHTPSSDTSFGSQGFFFFVNFPCYISRLFLLRLAFFLFCLFVTAFFLSLSLCDNGIAVFTELFCFVTFTCCPISINNGFSRIIISFQLCFWYGGNH